jgi:hypothetical protein
MSHDLHLHWLRLRRHLRSVAVSARAHRDAARAASLAPSRGRLCSPPCCLAA